MNSTSLSNVEVENPRDPSIDNILDTLLDPKVISKSVDQENRTNVAKTIIDIRNEIGYIQNLILTEEVNLGEREQQIGTLKINREQQKFALKQRLEKVLVSLKKIFGISDRTVIELETDIHSIGSTITDLYNEIYNLQGRIERLTSRQQKLPQPQEMLRAYYETMKNVPLSQEEKKNFLRPEILSQLTTEEYIALWHRLNPYFLSHVTRQGFRDHNGMIYHSAGLEEFHQGFTSILNDQKLIRPPIALGDGLVTRDDASIEKFIEEVLKADTEDEAKKLLQQLLHSTWASAPHYPDKTAVHFAAQVVSDYYYGGEKGNEIFFIYPSDVVASQNNYTFNGWEKDFTAPQSEEKWNDVFVWPSTLENPGIHIDAGFVFLPEDVRVDLETGSKYTSKVLTEAGKEKKVMVEDESLISSFIDWTKGIAKGSSMIMAYSRFFQNGCQSEDRIEVEAMIHQEMMGLGFKKEVLGDLVDEIIASLRIFMNIGKLSYDDRLSPEEIAKKILQSANAQWKIATNTISSKEYWEGYFLEHPEKKPKHIVFYTGSPTNAVHAFLRSHNIGQADVSGKEGKLLGFEDAYVSDMKNDPRSNRGYDDLVNASHRIIEEYFRSKQSQALTAR